MVLDGLFQIPFNERHAMFFEERFDLLFEGLMPVMFDLVADVITNRWFY